MFTQAQQFGNVINQQPLGIFGQPVAPISNQ